MHPPEYYKNEVRKITIPRPSTLMKSLNSKAEASRRKKGLNNTQKELKVIKKGIINEIRNLQLEYDQLLQSKRDSKRIIKGFAGDNKFTRILTNTPEEQLKNEKRMRIKPYMDIKLIIEQKYSAIDKRKILLTEYIQRPNN